jgi:hypothetical protein
MNTYTLDDQWRSFQTFVAVYLVGMLHHRDVFTISYRPNVLPPLIEFRCDAAGQLWFSMGTRAWSDDDGASLKVQRKSVNLAAVKSVEVLRSIDYLENDLRQLRLSGSGPASSVAVLAGSGFMSGDSADPFRRAAQEARMKAEVDLEGDLIDADAREEGQKAFKATRSGSTAAIVFANALADRRSWVDPFSVGPRTGYLVGGGPVPEIKQ